MKLHEGTYWLFVIKDPYYNDDRLGDEFIERIVTTSQDAFGVTGFNLFTTYPPSQGYKIFWSMKTSGGHTHSGWVTLRGASL